MQIDGNTLLVGIIASPVSHVRTPQLFNASVARQCLNAVCVPLHVEPSELRTWLSGATALTNLNGLIVTIPHKETVVAACDRLTDTARLVGSVNAMRLDRNTGSWVGGNFDGEGFVEGLRERGHTLAGQRVLQLGAGGAGKAMAFAIARERPAELVLYNRSPAKAAELVKKLQLELPGVPVRVGDDDPAGFDVVINATSLGLKDTDAFPLQLHKLEARTLICEAVVRDGGTPLLHEARKRGCAVHRGEHMLYGQIVEIARFLDVPLQPEFVARFPDTPSQ